MALRQEELIFDAEERLPSRSPKGLGWASFALLSLATILLFFGKQYPNLNGRPSLNVLGWIIGAVLVPATTLVYRQIEVTRSTENVGHLSNRRLERWMAVAMLVGVIVASVHALLYSLVRK